MPVAAGVEVEMARLVVVVIPMWVKVAGVVVKVTGIVPVTTEMRVASVPWVGDSV